MRTSTRPIALAAALAGSVLLGPAAQATVMVSRNTPHVCDWFFTSGPRNGQKGKESRAWLGVPPTYTTVAWWIDGSSGSWPITYTPNGSGGNFSLWLVEIPTGSATVTGEGWLTRRFLPYAETLTSSLVNLSNGGHVICQELNYEARQHLRTAYATTGSPCDCGGNFDYDRTVGCIGRCVQRWNRDSMWIGPAPDCLDSSKVQQQLLCLLSYDPRRFPEPPADCDLHPDDPRCGPFEW
jgi:hypothetical protein